MEDGETGQPTAQPGNMITDQPQARKPGMDEPA